MKKENSNNVKRQFGWLIFFIITFFNILIIELLVLAIEPLWADFNYYLGDMVGTLQINFVYILILIISIPLIYSGIIIILSLIQLIRSKKVKPHIVNKVVSIIFLAFFDFLLIILIVLFGEEAAIIGSLIMDNIIIIYMILIVILISIIPTIYNKFRKFTKTASYHKIKGITVLSLIIIGYIIAFILPFLVVPPNVTDQIPPKPKLIAHRGLSHLAPENTYIAWKLAKEHGANGIEIDTQISLDGKLFLMHDDTLKRTTNVDKIFPNRVNDDASSFNFSDLMKLNAGSWFVERDPYGSIKKGLINQTMINYYLKNVSIPTLEEVLNFCRDNNMILDVDFKYPAQTHPYYSQLFNLTLYTINKSGINQSLVWITSGNYTNLNYVKNNYPNMITALSIDPKNPPSVQEFLTLGYNMINSHYSVPSNVLKSYYKSGIKVNLWTVDILATFSQLWCLGATYITTNEAHNFVIMNQPSWYFSTFSYYGIWIVLYVFGLSSIFIFKYFSEKKELKN
ncbi:MAG: glycerophosphodiester phosphodiesterase family protein [Candidatus Helarchaeota archaeon]